MIARVRRARSCGPSALAIAAPMVSALPPKLRISLTTWSALEAPRW